MLSTVDHRRDKVGLTYVYPVLSRRSGGLSIGINLNTNNACNWACIYCQVPDLIRGSAAPVDIEKLSFELKYFLNDVIHGEFYQRESVPEALQTIKDIAISGNGEPTTANEFAQVVDLIRLVLAEYGLLDKIKCVLITNGSMVNRVPVKKGLQKLAEMNGEVWFKIDSARSQGIATINKIKGSSIATLKRLKIAAELCPTWVQTCLFMYKNKAYSEIETAAYIRLLETVISTAVPIKGVLLYGIERPSLQAEADKIKKLPADWLQNYSQRISELGFDVKVTP